MLDIGTRVLDIGTRMLDIGTRMSDIGVWSTSVILSETPPQNLEVNIINTSGGSVIPAKSK